MFAHKKFYACVDDPLPNILHNIIAKHTWMPTCIVLCMIMWWFRYVFLISVSAPLKRKKLNIIH